MFGGNRMEKKYKKGFTAGVFDLFHVGHLNLLCNCKKSCEYLVVGVLADDYVKYIKNKKPVICLEDRMRIVEAIKYVDEVVVVDFHNTVKTDAWELYQFDVCYSGDDHANEEGWLREQAELREMGSEIVFLPYTQSTSSTHIRNLISENTGLNGET